MYMVFQFIRSDLDRSLDMVAIGAQVTILRRRRRRKQQGAWEMLQIYSKRRGLFLMLLPERRG